MYKMKAGRRSSPDTSTSTNPCWNVDTVFLKYKKENRENGNQRLSLHDWRLFKSLVFQCQTVSGACLATSPQQEQAKLALKQPESHSCNWLNVFFFFFNTFQIVSLLCSGTSNDVSQIQKEFDHFPSGTSGSLKFKTRFLFSVEL